MRIMCMAALAVLMSLAVRAEPFEARRYSDYAAALGVDLIVGVPGKNLGSKWTDVYSDRPMCEVCSRLADEYKMRFAIHNHGRNPKTGSPL